MSQIRLVFSDIDDTLLGPGETLDPAVCETIRQVERRGIRFTFASGRVPRSIDPLAEQLGLGESWIVACNGALIYKGREVVQSYSLELAELLPLLETAVRRGYTVLYTEDTKEYCLCETEGSARKRRDRGWYHPVRPLVLPGEPLPDHIIKVNLLNDSAEAEQTEALNLALRQLPGLHITRYGMRGFEIVSAAADKWQGVRYVAERLGIPTGDILCIGDNENDKQMLTYAGVGATVANGLPEIKALSRYVSPEERQFGVADILRHYCL